MAGASAPKRGARHTAALEAHLRVEYGAAAVQLTGSGTAALALAMRASAPDGTRPRVAMPAWACYDLMTAADIVDAEVILYDLDSATLAPAAVSFAAALAQRPTAVVVAHWFGLPVPLAPLIVAVREAGAMFIEDAAQGVGGAIAERPLGSLGDFGILSFGRGKGRTGGGGGALLANDSNAVSQLRRVASLVLPAQAGKRGLVALAVQWAAGRPSVYAIPSSIPALRLGETVYHPAGPIVGMPEWSAAVVDALWHRSEQEAMARRITGVRWSQVAANSDAVVAFPERAGTTAGWLRFPVMANDASALRDGVARRLGIMPGYERILAELPLAPRRLVGGGPWPGATELARRLRTLPSHSLLRSIDVAAIVQLLGSRELRRP